MDKQGRPTGPGKIKEEVVQASPIIARIVLYNFNVDGNKLKREHKEYLQKKWIPLLRRAPVHVKLSGRTSKLGDRNYNQQLSEERVLRLKKFLMSFGLPESKVPGQEMRATGEDLARADNADASADMDRCVTVTVAWGVKSRSIPVGVVTVGPLTINPTAPNQTVPMTTVYGTPPSTPAPRKSTQFKIMHLGSVGVGPGAGHLFRIVDKTNQTETTIALGGPSVSFDLAPVSGKGEWVDFSTNSPHDLNEFVDYARLTEGPSALWWSATDPILTFGNTNVPPIRLKTGVTIGVSGGGVTSGHTVQLESPTKYKKRVAYDFVTGELYYE